MSNETIPIFVVGSGRCGTRTVYKLLSGIDHIEIYHEYLCTHIQQVAAMYYMGLLDKEKLKDQIMQWHGSAIHYSDALYWVDCSNKLSWIIEPLFELYPKAKFVWLVRDGRKVVSSFFHKLADEMYDDRSVEIMTKWVSSPEKHPTPPPEKKYWWNIPTPGMPFHEEFATFNRFQRVCYHWVIANTAISRSFEKIPPNQKFFVKLEQLTTDRESLKEFLSFFKVEYEDHFLQFLKKPRNVIFPMDFKLTEEELNQFYQIAKPMMKLLGYLGKEEYAVKY